MKKINKLLLEIIIQFRFCNIYQNDICIVNVIMIILHAFIGGLLKILNKMKKINKLLLDRDRDRDRLGINYY